MNRSKHSLRKKQKREEKKKARDAYFHCTVSGKKIDPVREEKRVEKKNFRAWVKRNYPELNRKELRQYLSSKEQAQIEAEVNAKIEVKRKEYDERNKARHAKENAYSSPFAQLLSFAAPFKMDTEGNISIG